MKITIFSLIFIAAFFCCPAESSSKESIFGTNRMTERKLTQGTIINGATVYRVDSEAGEKGLQREGLINSLTFSFYDLVKDYRYDKVTLFAPPNYRWAHPQSEFYYTYQSRPSDETLVFIIPGFGGMNTSGPALYLMEILGQSAMSSVVIDSPASQRFIEKSSFFGFSGIPETDAIDIETICLQFKNWIEAKRRKNFSKLVIIGTSLGGYNVTTLFLRKDRSIIKFDKYISISAPLSNLYGLAKINEMVDLYKKSRTQEHELPSILRVLLRAVQDIDPLDSISKSDLSARILEFTSSTKISEEVAKVLIGRSFYRTLENAKKAFWTRYKNDPYIRMPSMLKKISSFNDFVGAVSLSYFLPESELEKGPLLAYRREEVMYRDSDRNLQMSRMQGGRSDLCGEPLKAQENLIESASIINNLEDLNSDQFSMISWADDFLISESLIAKAKAKNQNFYLLREGGHLGGFYQNEFQELLLNLLTSSNQRR